MNLCFVYEKEGRRSEAQSHLQDALKIYKQLMMWDEVKKIEQRLNALEEQSRESIAKMRSELVPGFVPAAGTKKKKQGKIGPNSPCPCGSGKKFKKCCGA
jgi:preprotein translocase subunit SecA